MTTVSDTFNRADSTTVGAGWTEDIGDWAISGNTVTNSVSNSDAELRYTGASMASNDQYAEAVVTGNVDFRGIGVWVRHPNSTTRTYYMAQIYNGDSRELSKRVNGTNTLLGSATGTQTIPGTIRVEVSGSTVKGLWNGTAWATVTDTTITSGSQVGIFTHNAASVGKVDTFTGGDIVSATPKAVAGTVTATAAAAKTVQTKRAGTVTPTATLTRGSNKLVGGTVTAAGSTAHHHMRQKAVGGAVTAAGMVAAVFLLRRFGRAGSAKTSIAATGEADIRFHPWRRD